MNGCSAPGPTLPSATHPVLTSQSIQLSHPTVLILLGNDLKKREWEMPVEEVAVAGAAWLCVPSEELLSFQLLCQCSLPTWPRAFKGTKLLQTHCSPQFQMGCSQLNANGCFYSLTTIQCAVLNWDLGWTKSIFCTPARQPGKRHCGGSEKDPQDNTHRNTLPHPHTAPSSTSCFSQAPNQALSFSPPLFPCRRGRAVSQTGWVPVPRLTHRDDVVLAEAQLVVIVALEIQQGLGSAAPVARTGHVVLVVPLVALHAVVWGQVLAGKHMRAESNEKPQVTPSYLPKLARPSSQPADNLSAQPSSTEDGLSKPHPPAITPGMFFLKPTLQERLSSPVMWRTLKTHAWSTEQCRSSCFHSQCCSSWDPHTGSAVPPGEWPHAGQPPALSA